MPEAAGKTAFKQHQRIITSHQVRLAEFGANKSPGPQTDGTLVLVLVAGQVTVLLFAWGGIFMEIWWQSILRHLSIWY